MQKLSIERVVALLTPAFGALSAWLTGLIGQAVPGVNFTPTDVTALEVAGATAAISAALKWLHGRQKFVNFETDFEKVAAELEARVRANQPASLALSDLRSELQAHESTIIQAIGEKVHAPASAEQVAEAIAQAFNRPAAPAQPQAAPAVVPPAV